MNLNNFTSISSDNVAESSNDIRNLLPRTSSIVAESSILYLTNIDIVSEIVARSSVSGTINAVADMKSSVVAESSNDIRNLLPRTSCIVA